MRHDSADDNHNDDDHNDDDHNDDDHNDDDHNDDDHGPAPMILNPGRTDERGATLVLVALLLVALLVMAGLVLDFGLVRNDRQKNKSAADFATAAGLRGMAGADGVILPFTGVCEARRYLLANRQEFSDLSGTWRDGNGTEIAVPPDPCVARATATCSAAKTTWAWFDGSAGGGRIDIDIKSGYDLSDGGFADEAAVVTSDGTQEAGCDQLAVLVTERRKTGFGAVAGVDQVSSRIRSVGRVTLGGDDAATAALVLLERHECNALQVQGSSGAKVEVAGFGNGPGIIHSDSLGDGTDCSDSDDQNGQIFQVNSNPASPLIVAGRAVTPTGSEKAGILSTVALSGATGAHPLTASSPSPVEVCARVAAGDCATTGTITGTGPIGKDLVTRSVVDNRYLSPVRTLRDEAAARFAWAAPADLPVGWTEMTCAAPIPAAAKIWINCAGGVFDGNNKTFPASVTDIVINGSLSVGGRRNTFHAVSPERLYIKGSTSSPAISLGGNDSNIFINDGSLTDADGDGFVCDERDAQGPSFREPARVVIGTGNIVAEGAEKTLRMCQSFVFMMDSSGAVTCPVPLVEGDAPYNNSCRGTIRVAGSARLDWSAPNENSVTTPTAAELLRFEDLTFWTESSGDPSSPDEALRLSSIEGGGGVRLAGVFFTPNAKPFRVGGNGLYDIENAQFMSRKLEVAGNGTLLMRPDPVNAIQIPGFLGFALVR